LLSHRWNHNRRRKKETRSIQRRGGRWKWRF
jgi:hypothetical protein